MTLSHYALIIHDSPITPDVLRFRGTESLSRPFSWHIEFTTPQKVREEAALLKYASFDMQGRKRVHGVITGFKRLSANPDCFHYGITLESRLSLLSRSRRCALYQRLSVPEVVEQVLRSHGLEGPDFDFMLKRAYPARELITQWQETDLQFIQRILAEVGIWFRQTMNDTTGLDITLFADSPLYYVFDGVLPYREPSGFVGEEHCCWGVRTWHNAVPAKVASRGYNHQSAEPMDAVATVRSDAATIGTEAPYGGLERRAGDEIDAETESGAFYARLRHERLLNRSLYLHLFSNAENLSPGQVFTLQGSGLAALQDGVLTVFLSYRGARDSRLHVSLWGMPYRETYAYRPPEIPRPNIVGTLPGRIESPTPDQPYSWLDASGRYQVRMVFDRDDGEPESVWLWLRFIRPTAGERQGWHMPLLAGTEVGVAFHFGDPDRPYIAHAFHDSAHPDIVNRDNRSQNIMRTAAGNALRMEDRRGEAFINLATPYGTSQLNQGQIPGEPGRPRGAGFELRTDEYGVIRVAKGLFVTADGQTKAEGEALDMAIALREIDLIRNRIQQLAAAAEQAEALRADIASQIAMFDKRLKPLNETIHCFAPQGVGLASGEHIQATAAKNLAMNAGGDISIGSMGDTTLLAGEALGLFAHHGRLGVIAGAGEVQMQAPKGAIQLTAEQKLSLSCLSDMLFAGKKRVTLIGGGSYLKIEGRKIEYGTTGRYLRKTKRRYLAKSAAMPVSFPRTGTPYIYSAIYQLQDEQGNILAGTPYRLSTAGGQSATGYSDEQGRTLPIYTRQQEEVALHIVPRKPQPGEKLCFIGNSETLQMETEFRERN